MFGCRWFVPVVGLLLGSLLQIAVARAETQSPDAGDPPDAVGRIAVMSGTVLFRADPSQTAAPALLNYPLSFGNVVETAPRAHATIDIAAGRFYLDGHTKLRIGALSDGSSVVSLDQGALVLHVLRGGDGQVFTIETGKGSLRVDQPGYYEVEAGDDDQPAAVSALEGGAQFRTVDQGQHVLHPRERISFAGSAPERGAVVEDDLIRRVAAEIEEIGENHSDAPEHVSSQITGFQDLTRYGMWALTESYGPVWKPEVGSDWTPYSRGRWVDIAPWGKTWIDDAPWGFAPFHYGRWVKLDQRWAWLPGEIAAAPVYAPALVSFFDTPADKGAVRRWIALGPEEPYLPPYRTSIVYFRAINAPALPSVVNITAVTNIVQITNVVKIVERRPVLILNRLVNRPGAPPPTPKTIGAGSRGVSAMVVTQSGSLQTGPTWHPILPTPAQKGTIVILNSPPVLTAAPQLAPVVAQPQPVVIQTMPGATNVTVGTGTGLGTGATAPSAPIVVTRTLPSNNVTMGTGTPLGTQATAPARPTVTFGAAPSANSVTFP